MRIVPHRKPAGIAIFIVLVAIFALAALTGALAFSMKVETRLATHANNANDMECLGRSGIEVARWLLAQQMKVPNTPYDALNQVWAGGAGETNDPMAGFSFENIHVGDGVIRKINIADTERKFNINQILGSEDLMQHALIMMGVDAGDVPTIIASIEDWIDKDDDAKVNGAESEYYEGLNPPYRAKNGPIDDITELLFIKGISADLFSSNAPPAALQGAHNTTRTGVLPTDQTGPPPPKFPDIFTCISNGKINVNTASSSVLQMIPGVDENSANEIIQARSVQPFRNVADVAVNTSLGRGLVPILQRFGTVRSSTFEVRVEVEIGGSRRTYYALLVRNSPTDVQILNMHWE
jgi:general secretion pathway protein K